MVSIIILCIIYGIWGTFFSLRSLSKSIFTSVIGTGMYQDNDDLLQIVSRGKRGSRVPIPCLGVYGHYDDPFILEAIIEDTHQEYCKNFVKKELKSNDIFLDTDTVYSFILFWKGKRFEQGKDAAKFNILFHDFVHYWFLNVVNKNRRNLAITVPKLKLYYTEKNEFSAIVQGKRTSKAKLKAYENLFFRASLIGYSKNMSPFIEFQNNLGILSTNNSFYDCLHFLALDLDIKEINKKTNISYEPNNGIITYNVGVFAGQPYIYFFLIGQCENKKNTEENCTIITFNIVQVEDVGQTDTVQLFQIIKEAQQNMKAQQNMEEEEADNKADVMQFLYKKIYDAHFQYAINLHNKKTYTINFNMLEHLCNYLKPLLPVAISNELSMVHYQLSSLSWMTRLNNI